MEPESGIYRVNRALLDDVWVFENIPETKWSVPRGRTGDVHSREEWEALKARVEGFFDSVDNGTIELVETEKAALPVPLERESLVASGYIYLARSETGHYKIGLSKHPVERIKQLNNTPHEITLIHTFPADHAKVAEEVLHTEFSPKRVRGEWFALDDEDVAWLCSIQEYKSGTFYVNR